jgi:hypothetical protein
MLPDLPAGRADVPFSKAACMPSAGVALPPDHTFEARFEWAGIELLSNQGDT